MKQFNDAAESDDPAVERQWAEHGAMMVFAVIGTATCLMATLGDSATYPPEIIESVPPDLYEESRKLAPVATVGNTIKDPTPDRIWPQALVNALFIKVGCDSEGNIPGENQSILYCGDDFPEDWRDRRMQFAELIEETLRPFLECGVERIKQYLSYPYDINPIWLFMAVENAREKGVQLSDPLETWFSDCFDQVLQTVHQIRAEDGDITHMRQYN